nr:MAG: RNA-dependent RNA polymerase [Rhabdoviridae sp.]
MEFEQLEDDEILSDPDFVKLKPLRDVSLKSPLRPYTLLKVLDKIPGQKCSRLMKNDWRALYTIMGSPEKFSSEFSDIPHLFTLKRSTLNGSVPLDHTFTTSLEVGLYCWVIQANSLKQTCSSLPITKLPKIDYAQDIPLTWFAHLQAGLQQLVVSTSRHQHRQWSPQRDAKVKYSGSNTYTWTLDDGCKMACNGSFAGIQINGAVYLGTRDQLIMLSDLYSERKILRLVSLWAQELDFTNYLWPNELEDLFNYGDKVLHREGNNGFQLLSLHEATCVSVALEETQDEYCDTQVFTDSVRDDVQHLPLSLETREDWAWFKMTLHKWFNLNTNKLFQAFGLFRIWGHPIIDVLKGIDSLKQIVQRERPFNYEMIERVNNNFRRYFCMEYKRKEGCWPNLDLSALPINNYLRKMIEGNRDVSIRDKRYREEDWGFVESRLTFDIGESIEISSLIDDKSLSPKRDVLFNFLTHGRVGDTTSKSVIYNFMDSTFYNPKAFLEKIDREGFGPDEVVVGICPKERELKILPRFFGLLTENKRLTVVLTESMIAKYILPYFPEITMTDDDAALKKRILNYTKREEDVVRIVSNLDFRKWNSNMRYEETIGPFKFMDGLFGYTNVISRTHELFYQSQMYLADGSLVPELETQFCQLHKKDPKIPYVPRSMNWERLIEECQCLMKEDAIVWSGHLGGVEGLRQKGWTIITVVVLKMAAEGMDVLVIIMGQGDNQVVILVYKKVAAEIIRAHHKEFMTRLNDMLSKFGPPLKTEETWNSSHLFMYGKFPVLQGNPQCMSMKKLCRAFELSNEGVITCETALSSITANISAGVASDFTPIISTMLYYVMCCSALLLHAHNSPSTPFPWISAMKKNPRISTPARVASIKVPINDQVYIHNGLIPDNLFVELQNQEATLSARGLLAILLTAAILGGYPISLLIELLLKGFPDPLTLVISALKLLFKHLQQSSDPYNLLPIIQAILSPIVAPSVNMRMLVEDPLSINILHPSSLSEMLKRSVLEMLVGKVSNNRIRNQQFAQFIQMATVDQSALYEALQTVRPLDPRVLNKIISSTPGGVATQWINKFSKSGTLIKSRLQEGWNNRILGNKIMHGDFNYFQCILIQATSVGTLIWDVEKCSTVWANHLRNRTWRLPDGTIVGVTVASPVETFQVQQASASLCANQGHLNPSDGYLLCMIDPRALLRRSKDNAETTGGKPYFGAPTSDKISDHAKHYIKTQIPFIRDPLYLQACIGWVVSQESNLKELIVRIVRSFTNGDVDFLSVADGTMSGSFSHRFMDHSTEKGGLLPILWTIASAVILSSNTLTKYSKGGANVNLNFQSLYLWAQTLISWLIGVFRLIKPPSTFHFHIACPSCIEPVNETMMDCPPHDWDKILYSPPPGNPYCYVDAAQLKIPDLTPENKISLININMMQRLGCVEAGLTGLVSQFITEQSLLTQKGTSASKDCNLSWVMKIDILKLAQEVMIRQTLRLWLSERGSWNLNRWKTWCSGIVARLRAEPHQSYSSVNSFANHDVALDQIVTALSKVPGFETATVALSSDTWKPHVFQGGFRDLVAATFHLVQTCPYLLQVPFGSFSSLPMRLSSHPLLLETWRQILISGPETTKGQLTLLRRVYQELSKPEYKTSLYLLNPLKLRTGQGGLQVVTPDQMRTLQLLRWNVTLEHPDVLARLLPIYELRSITESITPKILFRVGSRWVSRANDALFPEQLSTFALDSPSCSYHIPIFDAELGGELTISDLRPYLGASSAPWKLLGLLSCVPRVNHGVIISCGDGAGGYSYFLTKTFPACRVFFNTFLDSSAMVNHAIGTFYPLYFSGDQTARNQLIGLEVTREHPNDLTSPECFAAWHEYFSKSPHPPVALVCDAEGEHAGSRHKELLILLNLVNFAIKHNIQWCIIKVYGGDSTWNRLLISIGAHGFKDAQLHRSTFSYKENSELFLVLQNPLDGKPTIDFSLIGNMAFFTNLNIQSVHSNPIWSPVSQSELSWISKPISKFEFEQELDSILPYVEQISSSNNPIHSYIIRLLLDWNACNKIVTFSDLVYFFRTHYSPIKGRRTTPQYGRVNLLSRRVRKEIRAFFAIWYRFHGMDKDDILNRVVSNTLIYYVTRAGQYTVFLTSDNSYRELPITDLVKLYPADITQEGELRHWTAIVNKCCSLVKPSNIDWFKYLHPDGTPRFGSTINDLLSTTNLPKDVRLYDYFISHYGYIRDPFRWVIWKPTPTPRRVRITPNTTISTSMART